MLVDEFTQTQVLGEGDRKEQPSIGHQAVVSRVNYICRLASISFARFTSSAWPRCWAASVR